MARSIRGSTGPERPNGPTDLAGLQGPGSTPDTSTPPAPPAPGKPGKSADKEKRNILAILLKDDGVTPDFDRMRPDTRTKFETAARTLGIVPAAGSGSSTANALPAEIGLALAQAIATIDQAIVARVTKAPRELVDLAAWTPEEKSAVAPLALAVANKYGGSVLSKYGEECALALTLVTLTQAKIAAIRQGMAAHRPPPSDTESS